MTYTKADIVNLIDLTSLNESDTNTSIRELCNKAQSPLGRVAAVCVYKEFVATVKNYLPNTLCATVINFPKGTLTLQDTLKELDTALAQRADEIDLVMPYYLLFENKTLEVEKFLIGIKKNCNNKTLKVILETGVLEQEYIIKTASKIAINAGADFIKTSTGKTSVNAKIPAVKHMLTVIKDSKSNCGLKVAGGVKTFSEAIEYVNLAGNIMGSNFIDSKTFRFGTSSLLDNLINSKINDIAY